MEDNNKQDDAIKNPEAQIPGLIEQIEIALIEARASVGIPKEEYNIIADVVIALQRLAMCYAALIDKENDEDEQERLRGLYEQATQDRENIKKRLDRICREME